MKWMKYITSKRKWNQKKPLRVLLWIIAFSAILAYSFFLLHKYEKTADPLQPQIAQKILRFHILANSDSEEDQKVKKKVRDAVGQMLEPKLAASEGLSDTERIVEENMDAIVETAERTLEENGFSYGAGARLARVDFPVKTYGDYTFPAGNYEALQVTLGKGEGHNWWCVLYPNMCFQGSVYEIVDDKADEELRQVLTTEEYQDVFHSGNLKLRWKFLEYFR
ncbi:MAG: stage II sporulation protein R [Agathobacter sp.]